MSFHVERALPLQIIGLCIQMKALPFKRKMQVLPKKAASASLPRTAGLQVLAQGLDVPGPLPRVPVGHVILQGGHAQEEICLGGDALQLKSRVCF